jgi:hypothetical protein
MLRPKCESGERTSESEVRSFPHAKAQLALLALPVAMELALERGFYVEMALL